VPDALPRKTLRQRVYEILERGAADDPTDEIVHGLLIVLIVLNVGVAVLESVPSLGERWGGLFLAIEIGSVAVFTMEYLLRLW
jgi:voltage-gated potassium channel